MTRRVVDRTLLACALLVLAGGVFAVAAVVAGARAVEDAMALRRFP